MWLSVPGFAIPADDALQERDYIRGKSGEKLFAFFRGGVMRGADITGAGAFTGDPALRGGGERHALLDGFRSFVVTDELGREAKHHGSFPLAGVTHLALMKVVGLD